MLSADKGTPVVLDDEPGKMGQTYNKIAENILNNIKSNNVVGATITKGDSVGDIHAFTTKLSTYMLSDKDYDYSFRTVSYTHLTLPTKA